MSAEKSASAVVLPINTLKLVNSFNSFKNGEFCPKNTNTRAFRGHYDKHNGLNLPILHVFRH
jgi:hypothetical protein